MVNALTVLKRCIRDNVELLDPTEVYQLGVPSKCWGEITKKLGLDANPGDVKLTIEAKDLRDIVKAIDKILLLKPKYAVETKIGQNFTRDVTPPDFPWGVLRQLQADCMDNIVRRRTLCVEGLTLVAKDQVARELTLARDKEHTVKVPKMIQGKRKTLAWHRARAKERKE